MSHTIMIVTFVLMAIVLISIVTGKLLSANNKTPLCKYCGFPIYDHITHWCEQSLTNLYISKGYTNFMYHCPNCGIYKEADYGTRDNKNDTVLVIVNFCGKC